MHTLAPRTGTKQLHFLHQSKEEIRNQKKKQNKKKKKKHREKRKLS